jgi:hypothetical protein
VNSASYEGLTPHFRQALANPLERTERAQFLDLVSNYWIDWSSGDYRWQRLAALARLLEHQGETSPVGAQADALGRLVDAAAELGRERNPMTVEDARLAVGELAALARFTLTLLPG